LATGEPDRGTLSLPGAELGWWPQFLPDGAAQGALDQLTAELPWRQESIRMFGRDIDEPRLVSWHGDPAAVYRYSGRTNQPQPWTPTLLRLRGLIEAVSETTYNSVLGNLYRSGADHMGWHSDDERELGPDPVIASLSLGGPRRMQFRARGGGKPALEVLLTSGSLLVMAGQTQRRYQHRIVKTARPTEPRINLTFRRVLPRQRSDPARGGRPD